MLNNNQCMTAALDIMCVLCSDLQVESPERVTEGDSVRLTCKSSCTLTDRATFIWYRNSQPLTERRDRNNELLLQSVRREDAGRYSCAVHGHNHISPAVQLNVMCEYKFICYFHPRGLHVRSQTPYSAMSPGETQRQLWKGWCVWSVGLGCFSKDYRWT